MQTQVSQKKHYLILYMYSDQRREFSTEEKTR